MDEKVIRPSEEGDAPPPRPPAQRSWFHATSGLWAGIGSLFAYVGGSVAILALCAGLLALFNGQESQEKCATACGEAGIERVFVLYCDCK